jgi:hypothetical protein
LNIEVVITVGIFAATIVVMLLATEVGFRFGLATHKHPRAEKESSVSAIVASILGLVAFMLAFTFAIVSDRYNARKELVRNEANAIETTYLRSEFLGEPDRSLVAKLLREYLDNRLAVVQQRPTPEQVNKVLHDSVIIQNQIWAITANNAQKNINSPILALFIESLNNMIDLHATRVAVALQSQIPGGIWLVLYVLIIFGMVGVGYQSAVTDYRRSLAMLILALSFSIVIALIVSLDRPFSGFIKVSQQPLINLKESMASNT